MMLEFQPIENSDETPAVQQLKDESWKITEGTQVGWALQKIDRLEAESKEWDEQAKAYHKMIDDWHSKQVLANSDSIAWLKAKLFLYQKEQLKRTTTPFGAISIRKPSQSLVVKDETSAIASLQDAGLDDLINVKKTVKRGDLKKIVIEQNGVYLDAETGVIIDGIALETGEEKLTITKPKEVK